MMSADSMETVEKVRIAISHYIQEISNIFAAEHEITVLVRFPDRPDSTGILISSDNLDEAIKAIERLRKQPPTHGVRKTAH